MAKFTSFNVGQGACSVYETNQKILVVDCGSTKYPPTRELNNFFFEIHNKIQNKKNLDIVISSKDVDHNSFLPKILEKIIERKLTIKINILLGGDKNSYNDEIIEALKKCKEYFQYPNEKANIIYADELPKLGYDEIDFVVLSADTTSKIHNNQSIVLKIKEFSIMIPGDAEGQIEKQLLKKSSEEIKSAVLVASHHGSITNETNTVKWLLKVNPFFIIVSSGLRKHWLKQEFYERTKRLKNVIDFNNQNDVHFTCFNKSNEEVPNKIKKCIFHTYDVGNISFTVGQKSEISIKLSKITKEIKFSLK